MFNFHKPRTYRSVDGCCICRAKSSSSRFTDSRKYERDTMPCFDLKYPRQGEICNACVLLVKRFKRLPVGSKRNWSHVVDARAGPGGTKIQTKQKSERTSSRSTSNTNTSEGASTNSSASSNNSNTSSANSSSHNSSAYTAVAEKFSKIMKKTKRKDSLSSSSSSTSVGKQRKSSNNGWSQHASSSLPTTPDSLDSDYEDSRIHSSIAGSGASGTVVQFQTQTRASAFRAQAAAEARRRFLLLGSKRRKCSTPIKNKLSIALKESVPFFDKQEWQERRTCCSRLYESSGLAGALILDTADYKPCAKHQAEAKAKRPELPCVSESVKIPPQPLPIQKAIIQTMPAVVQLQPPSTPAISAPVSLTSIPGTPALTITKSSTPALKKHHLFYKRQSECFPQGDMVPQGDNKHNYSNTTPSTKTESDYSRQQHTQYQQQHSNPSTTAALQRLTENAIHPSVSSAVAAANNYGISSSSALSISVTSVAATSAPLPVSAAPPAPPAPAVVSYYQPSSYASNMPQMPKHSLAKVTTISPPLTSAHLTTTSKAQSGGILHKIKGDPGKVVKHTLDKYNSALRVKSTDLHDLKPVIKTVDKSYIIAASKPPAATLNAAASANAATYHAMSTYNALTGQTTTTALSAASPTSSTSSTSSTKFSDNSSDSGFDENLLDRKSASPLQEDCEKKLVSRPGVQTMFLASGVQIQGQTQNLVLTGNEVAAKIMQNRKYNSHPVTVSNMRTLTQNHPTTTAVKIAQISTGGAAGHHLAASQTKMRAIYNSSNTIQHENGITTIVPASSLAATTQTAAMQNIAPSTVTITPAPMSAAGGGVAGPYSAQNLLSRKLTTANIINLQSNNLSNTNHMSASNNHGNIASHLMSASNVANNQKIILLKTAGNAMQASSQHQAAAVSVAKYNALHASAVANGVGGGASGAMGR